VCICGYLILQNTYALLEVDDYTMMFDHIPFTTYLPIGFTVYLMQLLSKYFMHCPAHYFVCCKVLYKFLIFEVFFKMFHFARTATFSHLPNIYG